jgi:hypothetical protein
MKYKNRLLICFVVILVLGLTSINVFGFLGFGSTEKWKEEVKLSDGRIIVVERKIEKERVASERSLTGSLKPKEDYIWFDINGSGKPIEWHTIKKSPRTYPEIPLILDLENRQPVIYTLVGVSPGCEAYNKYVFKNGTWVEEALPEKFELHTSNLLVKGRDIPKFVNLEIKQKHSEDPRTRREVKQVGPKREICE